MLIEKRNQVGTDMLNRNTRSAKAKYTACGKFLQRRCRELKNEWWNAKAADLHILSDTNDLKGFYRSIKSVGGLKIIHPDQLLATDKTTLFTEKEVLLKRWIDHFRTLLNEPANIDLDVTKSIGQSPIQN